MLKWFKRWYAETPQQVRYSWIYTFACTVGFCRLAWMLYHGAEFGTALGMGLMLCTFIAMAVPVLAMIIADMRTEKFTVWPQLDEMDKQIRTKAGAATAIVFYTYFALAMMSIMEVSDARGMETIPVSVVRHTLWLGVFVWIMSLAISTVVIYTRGAGGGESLRGTASGKDGANAQ